MVGRCFLFFFSVALKTIECGGPDQSTHTHTHTGWSLGPGRQLAQGHTPRILGHMLQKNRRDDGDLARVKKPREFKTCHSVSLVLTNFGASESSKDKEVCGSSGLKEPQ